MSGAAPSERIGEFPSRTASGSQHLACIILGWLGTPLRRPWVEPSQREPDIAEQRRFVRFSFSQVRLSKRQSSSRARYKRALSLVVLPVFLILLFVHRKCGAAVLALCGVYALDRSRGSRDLRWLSFVVTYRTSEVSSHGFPLRCRSSGGAAYTPKARSWVGVFKRPAFRTVERTRGTCALT